MADTVADLHIITDSYLENVEDSKQFARVAETHDIYEQGESGVDPVYQAKARLLNDAFQEIGMGKYQVW